MLDERGIYVTRVEEQSPMRSQVPKDVLGDLTNKKLNLEETSVDIYKVESYPERVPLQDVAVMD